jgi:hypothetical protein
MPLKAEDQATEGPEPIERTLLVDSMRVAVAFIDSDQNEFTLVWPLMEQVSLHDIVAAYLTDFATHLSQSTSFTIEYWIGDQYYSEDLSSDSTAAIIIDRIYQDLVSSPDTIELLQISSEYAVVEIVFDENSSLPCRVALLLFESIPVLPFMRFLSRFHRDQAVRKRFSTAFDTYYADGTLMRDAEMICSPIPVNTGGLHVPMGASASY